MIYSITIQLASDQNWEITAIPKTCTFQSFWMLYPAL